MKKYLFAALLLSACNSKTIDTMTTKNALIKKQDKLQQNLNALSAMRDQIHGQGSAAFDKLTSTPAYETLMKETYRLEHEVDSLKLRVNELDPRNSE